MGAAKHIGIIADEFELVEKSFKVIDALIESQVKKNIPIITIALGEIQEINKYFDTLASNPTIHENKIKIFLFSIMSSKRYCLLLIKDMRSFLSMTAVQIIL